MKSLALFIALRVLGVLARLLLAANFIFFCAIEVEGKNYGWAFLDAIAAVNMIGWYFQAQRSAAKAIDRAFDDFDSTAVKKKGGAA